jgi:hypothetical protein
MSNDQKLLADILAAGSDDDDDDPLPLPSSRPSTVITSAQAANSNKAPLATATDRGGGGGGGGGGGTSNINNRAAAGMPDLDSILAGSDDVSYFAPNQNIAPLTNNVIVRRCYGNNNNILSMNRMTMKWLLNAHLCVQLHLRCQRSHQHQL